MQITLPFQVTIAQELMTITYLGNGHAQILGLIDLSQRCHFALDGQNVICMGELGQLVIQAPEHTDAVALLSCIVSVVTNHRKSEQRRKVKETRRSTRFTKLAGISLTVAAMAVLAIAVKDAFSGPGIKTGLGYTSYQSATAMPAPSVAQALPPTLKTTPPAAPLALALPSTPGLPAEATEVADSSRDGWTLPDAARIELLANLRMAAERKLFSVEYSSGHARTLYVFADPECPNCQRLEPALEAAAKDFNVIVFPVAVIGGERSIASITPVLCLPPEQRKAAWSELFDVGHGVMDLGKPKESKESAAVGPGDCDIAGKALGVNEVAYQTYRIPGTPWAIADDGRHVSQAALQNSTSLQAFMSAAEVSHAAQ